MENWTRPSFTPCCKAKQDVLQLVPTFHKVVPAYARDLITVVRSSAILNSLFEFEMGLVVTAVTVSVAGLGDVLFGCWSNWTAGLAFLRQNGSDEALLCGGLAVEDTGA